MRVPVPTRAAVVALCSLAMGCRGCSRGAGRIDVAAVGPLGNVDDVDFAPYLTLAHAIIHHGPRPDVHPPTHAGQRAFVTYFSPGHEPLRATGLGSTLLDSVTRASEEAAKAAVGEGRIELDVLTSAEEDAVSATMRDSVFALGTHGYLASDSHGVGFVLPNEIVADKLVLYDKEEGTAFLLSAEDVRARLAARARVAPALVGAMAIARFGVSEHVEGAVAGEPPLALYRSMPLPPTDVSPARLLESVRLAGGYFARIVDSDGRFLYAYDPVADAPTNVGEYMMLRHAGAIYALMEAYEETRVPEWVTAAERAVAYLLAHLQVTTDGAFLQDSRDLEQEKVGGAGLALIALAKYQAATGDARNLDVMRSLAHFIVRQQYADGHLRDNADVQREVESERGRKRRREVFFNVGEAVLGLLRLYALDPSPEWLVSARKAADWVIDVRDARDDLGHLTLDHWISYALHDLVVLTGQRRYAEHAFKIARAIALAETTHLPAPDYAGTFGEEGDSSSSATRLEALASGLEIARFLGDAEDEARIRPLAMRLACFTRGQQLDAESAYFARNPPQAIGGVRESLINDDIRIDLPQHAASGWLRFARELRDPSWGRAAK